MGRYRISQEAEADLVRIHQYGVRNYGEQKADQYFYAFFDRFEKLANNPHLYSNVEHIRLGYRRSVCGVDNIYYRIDGNDIEIMAIIGQQDTKQWL